MRALLLTSLLAAVCAVPVPLDSVTTSDVQDLLNAWGLKESFGQNFKKYRIDGTALSIMNKEDIKSLKNKNTNLLHKRKLWLKISETQAAGTVDDSLLNSRRKLAEKYEDYMGVSIRKDKARISMGKQSDVQIVRSGEGKVTLIADIDVQGKFTMAGKSIEDIIASVIKSMGLAGKWVTTPATGCSDKCGQEKGASGKPGTVECSTGEDKGCDMNLKPAIPQCPATPDCRYLSCADIKLDHPGSKDGVYDIWTKSGKKKIQCDMTTDGGGWTLVTVVGNKGDNCKAYPWKGDRVSGLAECPGNRDSSFTGCNWASLSQEDINDIWNGFETSTIRMKPSGGKAGTDPWYLQRKLANNPHEPFDVFTAMRVPTMFGKLQEDYSINKNPKTYNAAENSVISLTSGPGAQCWELHDLTCAGKKQKVCRHGLPGDPTGGSQWAWYLHQKSGSGVGKSYGWSDENTYTKIWIKGTKPIDMQRYRSCADIKQYHPHSKNGIYEVNLKSGPQYVQCDMERDGGGWTLVTITTGKGDECNAVPWKGEAIDQMSNCGDSQYSDCTWGSLSQDDLNYMWNLYKRSTVRLRADRGSGNAQSYWYAQRNKASENFDAFMAWRDIRMLGVHGKDYSMNVGQENYDSVLNKVIPYAGKNTGGGYGAQCWETHTQTCQGKSFTTCRHGLPGDMNGGCQWAWHFHEDHGAAKDNAYGWCDGNARTKFWIRGTDVFHRSCADIKKAEPGSKDGTYNIATADGVVPVFCDMTRHGGGWTLITVTGGGGNNCDSIPWQGQDIVSLSACGIEDYSCKWSSLSQAAINSMWNGYGNTVLRLRAKGSPHGNSNKWWFMNKNSNPGPQFDAFMAMRDPRLLGANKASDGYNQNIDNYDANKNRVTSSFSKGAQFWEDHSVTCNGKKFITSRHGLPGDPTGGSQWVWYFNQQQGAGKGNSYGWSTGASTTKLWIKGSGTAPPLVKIYSCNDYKKAYPGASDGTYTILIGSVKTQVYCDMSRDGGGWTLVTVTRGGGDSCKSLPWKGMNVDGMSRCKKDKYDGAECGWSSLSQVDLNSLWNKYSDTVIRWRANRGSGSATTNWFLQKNDSPNNFDAFYALRNPTVWGGANQGNGFKVHRGNYNPATNRMTKSLSKMLYWEWHTVTCEGKSFKVGRHGIPGDPDGGCQWIWYLHGSNGAAKKNSYGWCDNAAVTKLWVRGTKLR